jgi:hypothetical protein
MEFLIEPLKILVVAVLMYIFTAFFMGCGFSSPVIEVGTTEYWQLKNEALELESGRIERNGRENA